MDRSPWTLYRLRRDRLFAIEQRGAREAEPIIEEGPGNRFLRALPPPLSERLSGHLERMPLERGTVLFHAGASTGNLYFPDRGLVSLVKTMSDGRTAEVGFVGTEGLVGVAALVGMERAAFETIVQLDGAGRMVKAALLRAEMQQSASLKELVLRYLYCSVHQLAQTAACNRLHTLRQRCCRWLLTAEDNAGAPSFTLTHEFLALMMGVNRPSLSLAIAGLKRRGLVEYVRASISVLDRRELEKGTCECYWALRQESDRVYAA